MVASPLAHRQDVPPSKPYEALNPLNRDGSIAYLHAISFRFKGSGFRKGTDIGDVALNPNASCCQKL